MDDEYTVAEAKKDLRAGWEKGLKCPCCGQLVKLYKRKLNNGMILFLINLYRASENGEKWHHAKTLMHGSFSMDYAMLRRWQLIVEQPNDDDAKRTSGVWGITTKGTGFVEGSISVPSHVHIYNDTVIGWSDERITVREGLSEKFDYSELMGQTL